MTAGDPMNLRSELSLQVACVVEDDQDMQANPGRQNTEDPGLHTIREALTLHKESIAEHLSHDHPGPDWHGARARAFGHRF